MGFRVQVWRQRIRAGRVYGLISVWGLGIGVSGGGFKVCSRLFGYMVEIMA